MIPDPDDPRFLVRMALSLRDKYVEAPGLTLAEVEALAIALANAVQEMDQSITELADKVRKRMEDEGHE
jgi:hypothetical protein